MLKLSEDAKPLIASPESAAPTASRPVRVRLLPLLILLAGAATTLVIALEFAQRDNDRVTASRDRVLDLLSDDIERQRDAYIGVLRAARALFDASDEVTRAEFDRFIESNETLTRLPGFRALGWSEAVPRADLDAYAERVRSDETLSTAVREAFEVWPPGGTADPAVLANFVAPVEATDAALGLDLTTDPTLFASISATRATGEPVASGPIDLSPEGAGDLGAIIQLAVFDDGSVAQEGFAGVLGAIIGMEQLLTDVRDASDVEFVVTDRGVDSTTMGSSEPAVLFRSTPDAVPSMNTTIVDFGGRQWEVSLARGELGGAGRLGLVVSSLAGALATIGLAFGVWVLQRSGARSEQHAMRLTEHLREANDELEETSARLKQAISSAGVGLWERNIRTGEGWGYEDFEAMLGDEPGSWNGYETFLERLHPDDRDHVTAAPGGGGPVEHTFRLRHADGDYRWILSRSELVERHGEHFVIGAHMDVTDRPERIDRVEHLNRELVRANQSLRDFTHVASHDLRSPLRAIASLVSFIREDAETLDETTEHHLERIEQRTTRMNMLIDGLLAYARAGGRAEAVAPADVDQLLADVVETVDTPPGTEVSLDSDVGTVPISAAAFSLCARNLVDNAIKHNPGPDRRVDIRATRSGNEIVCEVADDGPGIAEEYRGQVFEPFRRLRNDESAPGSGIGLAVIQRTLDAHGASLDLESEVDVGSTFRIRWPVS